MGEFIHSHTLVWAPLVLLLLYSPVFFLHPHIPLCSSSARGISCTLHTGTAHAHSLLKYLFPHSPTATKLSFSRSVSLSGFYHSLIAMQS